MRRLADLLGRKPWLLIVALLAAFCALWIAFLVVATLNKPEFFKPGEQPALPARP